LDIQGGELVKTRIGINDFVWVRLTPQGEAAHRLHFDRQNYDTLPDDRPIYHPPITDKEGWICFDLWTLMRIFGADIGQDEPNFFVDGVILIDLK